MILTEVIKEISHKAQQEVLLQENNSCRVPVTTGPEVFYSSYTTCFPIMTMFH